MTIKVLTEHHLEFLRLKGGYTGLPESTHVKMKSNVAAQHLPYLLFGPLGMMPDAGMLRSGW